MFLLVKVVVNLTSITTNLIVFFFFFDQWLHIRKDEYRKCHLSNTHFAVGWKREKKIRTCFQEIITLQKDREKISSDLNDIMETKWNVFIYS